MTNKKITFNDLRHSDFEVEIASTFDQIEKLRPFWKSIHKHPNSDIDFYISVIQSRENIISPHVFILKQCSTPISLLIGRIEHHPFNLNFGYKNLYKAEVPTLVVIYEGLLGDNSLHTCQLFYKSILHILSSNSVDLVYLSSLKDDSGLFNLLKSETHLHFRDHFPVSNMHWKMALPKSMEDFYTMRSRKHRYWLRRLTKVLEKDFAGNLTFRIFLKSEEVDILCRDAEEVAKHTYHRGLGAGFIDSVQQRNMFKKLAEMEELRAYVLYICDTPSAFWIGRRYLNAFHLAYTGYLPQHEKYELGTILFLKMLENLISLDAIDTMDFGFGDAPYKKRFADTFCQESSVYLFPNTIKGFLLNSARSAIMMLHIISISVLNRLDLLEKLKKIWRKRLSKNTQPPK